MRHELNYGGGNNKKPPNLTIKAGRNYFPQFPRGEPEQDQEIDTLSY
jgi:hypothetical protein